MYIYMSLLFICIYFVKKKTFNVQAKLAFRGWEVNLLAFNNLN